MAPARQKLPRSSGGLRPAADHSSSRKLLASNGWDLRLIRSPRRHRTLAAALVGSTLEVRIPVRLSVRDELEAVADICRRLLRRSRPAEADRELFRRAKRLDRQYLGGVAAPASALYSPRLRSAFANADLLSRTVKISERLRGAPRWVLDYLLLHELAHLVEPPHSVRFWRLVDSYRYAERAKGYLICLSRLDH